MNMLIIGRRGLGKSTLAMHEAEELNPNVIIFDPSGQFESVDFRTSKLEDFFDHFEGLPDDKPYRLAYVTGTGQDIAAAWSEFARRLWDYVGEHEGGASFVLIIDEAHRMQSPWLIDDMLDEFIRRSPRRERGDKNPVDLIQTTHYPQDLNRVSWGESDVIFLFNVFHKNARKAIEDQFGERVADEVAQLKTPKTGGREVMKVDSETGTFIIIDNEEDWYYNIRKPSSQEIAPGIRRESDQLESRYGRL